jgi:hypothetical protein
MRNSYKYFGGKIPLQKPRSRRENNIKIYLWKIVKESVDWIRLAQDKGRWRALMNTVTKTLLA